MKRDRTPQEMPLGDIGFAMKVEAGHHKGDVLHIRRDLWLEIADVLMDADIKIRTMERITKELLKKGKKND